MAPLIAYEYRYLQGRRESQAIARANERVAENMEAARVDLTSQKWDQAIRHLEDALTVERATNREEVRPLLAQAQRSQADALLEAAEIAINRKDSVNAFWLIDAYRVHPQARDAECARLLREDLERAVSDERASQLLARLSDDALNRFEKSGRLAENDGIAAPAAQAIFQDTLRRLLPEEQSKRASQRESVRLAVERRAAERVRQIDRLRATPAYRSLSAFVARTRMESAARAQRETKREAELAQLFQQLGVTDAGERTKIRADLRDGEGGDDVVETVKRQRAEVKRAYRASPEFHAADRELFDRLVDEKLDDLLKQLSPSS